MTDKGEYLKKISSLLSRFTMEQLTDIVFGEIELPSVNRIRREIVKSKLPFTKASLIKILVEKYIAENPIIYLKEDICTLRSLDLALHHHRRVWFAIELYDTDGEVYRNCTRIQESIETKFYNLRRTVEVGVSAYEGFYWIWLLEKARGSRSKSEYKTPVFAAYILGEPYLFISQSGKNDEILKVIHTSLGFKKFRNCRLCGQHIKHLYMLLKSKKCDASSSEEVLHLKEYEPEAPEEVEGEIDFTQKAKRDEYIKQYFPKEGAIQELHVTSSACRWEIQDIVPGLDGKNFQSTELSFRSPNMMKLLNELGSMGILPVPFPEYVVNVQKKATNVSVLRSNNTNISN